ncbi:MAG TPA: hypothetical protein ENN43_08165 [bacterium]|nr:hypothetical protein [bacterium]
MKKKKPLLIPAIALLSLFSQLAFAVFFVRHQDFDRFVFISREINSFAGLAIELEKNYLDYTKGPSSSIFLLESIDINSVLIKEHHDRAVAVFKDSSLSLNFYPSDISARRRSSFVFTGINNAEFRDSGGVLFLDIHIRKESFTAAYHITPLYTRMPRARRI